MELKRAIDMYNMHCKGFQRIYYADIARDLKISRQALYQLMERGGKHGLLKYKEELKEILPEEVYSITEFPKKKKTAIRERGTDKIRQPRHRLTDDELKVICSFPYMFTPESYKRIIDTHIMTEYMFNKKMGEIEEEKKRLEGLNALQ